MKKLIAILLSCLLVLMPGVSAHAAAFPAQNRSCVVLGADLSEEQAALVYQAFGITRGSVTELRLTNAEERLFLQGYVDPNVIGTRSISSVYLELLPSGSNIDVRTSNVNWCTPQMYTSALATAGITDARVVVAAPFEVSGTAALAGVYKAYEDITGHRLDDTAKAVSTQELTVTGQLASEIGSFDSTSIINDLKQMSDLTSSMSDEEIRQQIIRIVAVYNVTLTDRQIGQLISLCRALEKLDAGSLQERVEQVQSTLGRVSEAKTQVVGFVQKLQKTVTAVRGFIDRVSIFFGWD